jgi:hypothetical protein
MADVKNPRLIESASGIFEIRYSEKKDGGYRSRVLSTRTNCRDEAEAFFVNWRLQVEQAVTALSTPTVADLCSRYSLFLESENKGATQRVCVEHLKRELGAYHVADLTPERLQKYRRDRAQSSGTLRRELGALRAILSYAEKHKIIAKDSSPTIDLPKPSQPRRNYLKKNEEADFHARAMALSNGCERLKRLSLFVAIGLCTGARKEAIETLTWQQVDLVAGVINFREEGRTLSNKRRAIVPISSRLLPILQRAYDQRVNEYVLDNPGAIRKSWERWVVTTPYKISPHDMRRTMATLSLQAGVSPAQVAAILGDTIDVVLSHYLSELPEATLDAINKRFA